MVHNKDINFTNFWRKNSEQDFRVPNLPFLLFQIKLQFDYQDFLLISTGIFLIFNHTEVHAQYNFSG